MSHCSARKTQIPIIRVYEEEIHKLMLTNKYYRALLWLLTLFVTAWFGARVTFVFRPLLVIFNVLFVPLVLAFVLYYLVSPLVFWLERKKIPRTVSILLVFFSAAVAAVVLVVTIGYAAYVQMLDLAEHFPEYLEQLQEVARTAEWPGFLDPLNIPERFSLGELIQRFSDWLMAALPNMGSGFAAVFKTISNAALAFVLLPVMLFYFLKEKEYLSQQAMTLVPERYQRAVKEAATDIDRGLAAFINGQLLISLSVGTMMFIALSIIGLDHALVLSLISLITNLVPYLGPILGAIPALIIGFVRSPQLGLQVLIAVIIVQQLESLLITPQVMGKKLAAHPLAIILSLILIGSLVGIVGLFLAMPIFVIGKIIFSRALAAYHRTVNARKS